MALTLSEHSLAVQLPSPQLTGTYSGQLIDLACENGEEAAIEWNEQGIGGGVSLYLVYCDGVDTLKKPRCDRRINQDPNRVSN